MNNLLSSTILYVSKHSHRFAADLGFITPPPTMRVTISDTISRFVNFAMGFGSVIFLLVFIWGCIEWITSAGEKGKLENARARITTGVVGFIILASIWAIFNLVISFTYKPPIV